MGRSETDPGQDVRGGEDFANGLETLVERFIELQPRIEQVLTPDMPAGLREALGSVTAYQLEAIGRLPPGGFPMSAFASALGIGGAAATSLADRLVDQGLARRGPAPDDRRTVRLIPTAGALELTAGFGRWRRRRMAQVLHRLAPQQVTLLIDLLEGIAEPHPDGRREWAP